MLLGEYQHTLDEKGRLTVPSRLREALGETTIVTRGLENCLFLFPLSTWQELAGRLAALPLTQGDARAFVRFFFSGATECTFDRQGRVMLPQPLREFAGLDREAREAVIIGVSTRVEIWSAERWAAYRKRAEQRYEEIAEKIVDLGI